MSDNRDIEYIDFARGYMHYFGYHFRDSLFAAINCTYENATDRLVITQKEFNHFKQQPLPQSILSPLEKALAKIKVKSESKQKRDILYEIDQYKSKGRAVFVLFAHVFYDVEI